MLNKTLDIWSGQAYKSVVPKTVRMSKLEENDNINKKGY